MNALATTLGGGRPRLVALWAAAGALAAGAWLALGWLARPEEAWFTVCALRRVTEIPCPGCGMTRALAALARGEVAAAMRLHPLSVPLLLEAAGLWLVAGWQLWRRRPLLVPDRLLQAAVIWHGVAFLAVWLVRAVTGTLP